MTASALGDLIMRFEHRHEPLLPKHLFLHRLSRHALIAVAIVGTSLAIGVVGYRWSGHLSWLDSLYNASMILGGMGPVDDRGLGIPPAEKWFASAYALFAGMALLVIVGVMFAPLFHRFLHHFHLVEDEEKRA